MNRLGHEMNHLHHVWYFAAFILTYVDYQGVLSRKNKWNKVSYCYWIYVVEAYAETFSRYKVLRVKIQQFVKRSVNKILYIKGTEQFLDKYFKKRKKLFATCYTNSFHHVWVSLSVLSAWQRVKLQKRLFLTHYYFACGNKSSVLNHTNIVPLGALPVGRKHTLIFINDLVCLWISYPDVVGTSFFRQLHRLTCCVIHFCAGCFDLRRTKNRWTSLAWRAVHVS